ncbi:MAG TPA: aminoacyl-histidine dipeptidase [Ignavibacteriaceae bacterium]|nr:aminoacyl-histidine dipeptidase [Ignavibacteriaceae bacterium]
MGEVLGHLQPSLIWNYFEEICKYPRGSKKEEKIADYVISVGKKLNLETFRDSFGNVIIRKPASPGKENVKPVILQGHLDMVCEKNRDVQHNFEKDPIHPYIDGNWVKAKGTTLGADNGIGVAAALAVLESGDIENGPLECLFTLDEETGLTGASNLQQDILSGKILINMDSEEEGTLYIGCAGGITTHSDFPFRASATPKDYSKYEIKVSGLLGGHSGLEINSGRGNAIKILVRLLKSLSGKFKLKLAKLEGGNKHNAIPRESFAVVAIPKNSAKDFLRAVEEYNNTVRTELAAVEPNLSVAAEKARKAEKVMDGKSFSALINALYAVPHGVIKMSADIPGLVETSTNLATISTDGKNIHVVTSQRSSVASELTDILDMVKSVWELSGAEINTADGYPGWKPDVNSEILGVMKKTYRDLYGKEPEVKAIHAGLECGIIGEKYPGLDMISFGPTMYGVHSPDEKLQIDTVPKFWDLLVNVLKNIK